MQHTAEISRLFFFHLRGRLVPKPGQETFLGGEKRPLHYENTPMQHTAIFHGCKNDNFQLNVFD